MVARIESWKAAQGKRMVPEAAPARTESATGAVGRGSERRTPCAYRLSTTQGDSWSELPGSDRIARGTENLLRVGNLPVVLRLPGCFLCDVAYSEDALSAANPQLD